MEKNSVSTKLDELYADNKSRNFINHLVKAYFPVTKTVKVFEKPETRMYCVVTNKKLVSVSEILSDVQSEEFKESLNANLKAAIDGNVTPTAMNNILNGKVLGFTGEKTTTFISFEGIKGLVDWINTKVLQGDKHISWLVNSILREHKPVKQKSFAEANGYRKPSTTFGELDVLQKLKLQFEEEER